MVSRGLRGALVVLLFLLAGCTRPDDGVIRFALASLPDNLDPRFATDATSTRLNRLLYRRLVEFDRQARPVPGLAHWEQLSPQRYRFHLGEGGRRFHNGQRLQAQDVAATYRYVLDPAQGSPHRGTLALIERIEVLDADTLDFILERPDPLFPGYLVIGILPAASMGAGHAFQEQPLGSGPFRWIGRGESGDLHLARIRDGQRLHFLPVRDPTVRVLKLLGGEVDLLQNDLPAELLGYLRNQPEVQVVRGPGSNFAYIGFNLQDATLKDPRVRRAIAHAIDREAIITHLLGGGARPAAALLPPNHWAGAPGLKGLEYDPKAARRLLREAGYGSGRPLRLQYKTSSDPLRLRIVTVFQRQLAEVGIDLEVRSYDWGTFYGDIKAGRFQLYSLAWVGIQSPDIFRYAFFSTSLPPQGANRGRVMDGEVDRLILAAEAGESPEEQARYYRALQARLLELLPYVPLWYEDHVYAGRRELRGYRLALDGNYDALEFVYRAPKERAEDPG
jgi:peptide/nickel transport system substrate-binding protein